MRVIPRNVLAQKLNETSCEYISKLKLLYWFATYGRDIDMQEGFQNEEKSND